MGYRLRVRSERLVNCYFARCLTKALSKSIRSKKKRSIPSQSYRIGLVKTESFRGVDSANVLVESDNLSDKPEKAR